jgi:hypothetical protein
LEVTLEEAADMDSDLVSRMGDLLRTEPPREGTRLRGWVMLAEWVTPEGERHFERFGEPSSNSTQLKGYLHGGIYRMVTTGFDERRSA